MRQGETLARALFSRRRVEIASGLVLALVLGLLAVFALNASGVRRHRAELNDGGIWVTNNAEVSIAKLNKPISQLDGRMRVGGAGQLDLDVLQDGSSVVGRDKANSSLFAIDPTQVIYPEHGSAGVPSSWQVSGQAGTVAAVDPESGALRASHVPAGQLPDVSAIDAEAKPVIKIGGGANVTVLATGDVVAISADKDTITRVPATDEGLGQPETKPLSVPLGEVSEIAAVGNHFAVLDKSGGRLVIDDDVEAAASDAAVLQQSSKDGSQVLLSQGGDLLGVDIESGDVSKIAQGNSGSAAQPAQIKGCTYAVWGGSSTAVVTACPGSETRTVRVAGGADDPVFRVNRGQIVLNDRTTGQVWNIDSDNAVPIANWKSLTPPKQKHEKQDKKQTQDADLVKPKAEDDNDLGARVGQTTTLHVLDNDKAPKGRLLAIRSLTAANDPRVDVRVSPDAQTVQLRVPSDLAQDQISFEYTIDAGNPQATDRARVDVHVRRPQDTGEPPALREGYKPLRREWSVNSGGTLELPVLADWRDNSDGDSLALTAATDDGKDGLVNATNGGAVRFKAPVSAGTHRVTYTVTDSSGQSAEGSVLFNVLDGKDRETFIPPAPQPDVVRGEVGKPITISPLGNDLPGLDAMKPFAELRLAKNVEGGLPAQVDTGAGTITVKSSQPRTYWLNYTALYGDERAKSQIRVDISQPRKADLPVTMPDSVRLKGSSSATVDVLANDLDPSGGLLTVQGVSFASPKDARLVDASVVSGRWVRVRTRGELQSPVVVNYRVSNGASDNVEGELLVSWQPAISEAPVAVADEATVRSGQAVQVPVLENDFAPSGEALKLLLNIPNAPNAGELPASVGHAYVAGGEVRFVAPDVSTPETARVEYSIVTPSGLATTGQITIAIVPPPSAKLKNQPPTPALAEGRVVAGDATTISVPTLGVDPEGDPVAVVGLASAPQLGRVLQTAANSLQYQAFPGRSGTDVFQYQVEDIYGARSTGFIRVAISRPGAPQPPQAVDDAVVAAPSSTMLIDVMSNDVVATGDVASVTPVGVNAKYAKVDPASGLLTVQAPAEDKATRRIFYQLDNGLGSPSRAAIVVKTRAGYNNPPVVGDAYPTLADPKKPEVEADLNRALYDPEGGKVEIKLPPGLNEVAGKVKVPVLAIQQVIPFSVTDAQGAASSAVIYVPGTGDGGPYVLPGAVIKMDVDESKDVPVSDVIGDLRNREVRIVAARDIGIVPAPPLVAKTKSETILTVGSKAGYEGPGALSLAVTDRTGLKDKQGRDSFLMVPVVVGNPAPVVTCPTGDLEVAAGALPVKVDIGRYCHVWTANPADAENFELTANWKTDVSNVSLQSKEQHLTLTADASARPGDEGVVEVSVTSNGKTAKGLVNVAVVDPPPPTMRPITLDGLIAGESQSVDIRDFATSPLVNGQKALHVVSVKQLRGKPVQTEFKESSITLTPAKQTFGAVTLRVVVSDSADDRPGRLADAPITVQVMGPPGVPGAPIPETNSVSQRVSMYWRPSAPNGAEILRYEIGYQSKEGDSGTYAKCVTTRCTVPNLRNGDHYVFRVRGENQVAKSGWSGWSSPAVEPNEVPGTPGNFHVVSIGDHYVQLAWTKPGGPGTVEGYLLSGRGGAPIKIGAGLTTYRVAQLDNNIEYSFELRAWNDPFPKQATPARLKAQSSGKPNPPGAVRAEVQDGAGNQAIVNITWNPPAKPEGPGPLTYTVYKDGRQLATGLSGSNFRDNGQTYDGRTHDYTVTATNATGGPQHTSGQSAPASIDARGVPDPATNASVVATGENGQLKVSFSVGELRDVSGSATVLGQKVSVRPNQTVTITVNSLNNGISYTPEIVISNTKNSSAARSAGTEIPYGPLAQSMVNLTSSVSGTSVCWSIHVNTNGRPAHVSLSGSRGSSLSVDVNSMSWSTSKCTDIGYSSAETATLTLSSSGRGSFSETRTSGTTIPQPNPTESWRKGQLITSGCGAIGSSCYKVQLLLQNYRPNSAVKCFIGGISAPSWQATIGVDQNGNYGWAYPRDSAGNYVIVGVNFNVGSWNDACVQQ